MTSKNIGIIPIQPVSVRGQSTKLSAHKGKIVYANGRTVVIRNLEAPSLGITYSQHVKNTSCARISPSGFYCASGDESGLVKIWDVIGEEQILKAEYRVISGRVNDIAWDADSKRLIAVGNSPGKFGHIFMLDTGTSSGEITGHDKENLTTAINSVSIRQQRPYRAATAGDDNRIIFFHGAPYKKDKLIETHTSIVQDVRYSSSGDHFASVGSDTKCFIYDGKTGDNIGSLTADGHKGSIMACSWSPDSQFLATASMDRSVKLWDIEAQKVVNTWNLGTEVGHQQIGTVWSDENEIVSLSLSSDLNIFDRRVASKPARLLQGASKPIMKLAASSTESFIAGCGDGRSIFYSSETYTASTIKGSGHSSVVTGLARTPSGKVVSVGYDDYVREVEGNSFNKTAYKTNQQPKGVAAGEDGIVFVAEIGDIEAIDIQGRSSVKKRPSDHLGYNPSCIASAKSLVAVGGEDQKIRIYEWRDREFQIPTQRPCILSGNKDAIITVAFNPDGTLLASADKSGKIIVFDINTGSIITNKWWLHSARVESLAWTADGRHCASGSLDTNAYVWSLENPTKSIAIKNCGPGGLNAVHWIASNSRSGTLCTTGADGCIRIWQITFHA